MASLLNTQTNQQILLRSLHILGRHPGSCNTLLNNPEASRLHASILWNGSYWLIQDTSSNGTFVNSSVIATGVKTRLKADDIIQFGGLNACPWVFSNDDAPKDMLLPINSDSLPIELEGIVVLPNEKLPEITLYQSSGDQWLCEDQKGIVELESGAKISTNNLSWYFISADTFDETIKSNQLNSKNLMPIKVDFTVSKNEEHVSLCIHFGKQTIDLGERIHHYLLLMLARKRLEDGESGLEDGEQGWIDNKLLSRQTGLDENHINIQIYRFRKQLIKACSSSTLSATQLIQIIERRRGELRFSLKTVYIANP